MKKKRYNGKIFNYDKQLPISQQCYLYGEKNYLYMIRKLNILRFEKISQINVVNNGIK